MAAGARRFAGSLCWLRVGNQVAVSHGVVVDGELEDPVEQHAAAAGSAAVEAEHELIEVIGQVGVSVREVAVIYSQTELCKCARWGLLASRY